ncbi:MAG: arginase family protein [Candidatus Nanoarchaeia archaeon]
MKLYTDNGFTFESKLSETFTYPRYDIVREFGFSERVAFVVDDCAKVVEKFLWENPKGGVVLFSSQLDLKKWASLTSKLVYVGTREATPEEANVVRQLDLKRYPMSSIMQEGLAEIAFALMEVIRGMEKACVIIDLSVLDPAFVDVGQDVGGLSTRELLFFIQKIKMIENVKGLGVLGKGPIVQKILTEFY